MGVLQTQEKNNVVAVEIKPAIPGWVAL